MFSLAVSPLELVARSVAIYLAMLLALRLFGKREVGQFTLFDLVLVLLVANAVQPAMTGPDTSLGGGLLIIATLVVANRLLAALRERVPAVRRLLGAGPATIARDGQWLPEAIRHEGLDLEDCEMALREHGIADIDEVELAVLEPDGNISVVPRRRGGTPHGRRRVRYVRRR